MPSKNPLRASATNDAAVAGAAFWSTWIVNRPQLVQKVTP